MSVKYAVDVVKEIKEGRAIVLPDDGVCGEDFEKWLKAESGSEAVGLRVYFVVYAENKQDAKEKVLRRIKEMLSFIHNVKADDLAVEKFMKFSRK